MHEHHWKQEVSKLWSIKIKLWVRVNYLKAVTGFDLLITKFINASELQSIKWDKEIKRQYSYGYIKLVMPSALRVII